MYIICNNLSVIKIIPKCYKDVDNPGWNFIVNLIQTD